MVKEFSFNNESSKGYNIIVKSSNHLSIPPKSIESIKVPGRTGNLIIDDGSKDNLKIELELYIDNRRNTKNLVQLSREIGRWLQDPIGYKDLVFDDGLKFKAICDSQLDISEMVKNFSEFKVTFDAYEVES